MLIFLAALIIAAGFLQWQSLKDPFSKLSLKARTTVRTADPDEPFKIECTLKNESWIPRSWVRCAWLLPARTTVDETRSSGPDFKVALPPVASEPVVVKSSCFLRPHGERSTTIWASCPSRGLFRLARARVVCGDFLGFTEREDTVACLGEVVILPRRAKNDPSLDALGGFLGEVSVRRFIMDDPVLTLGFREYTGRESMRMIAWKQSAQGRGMMVRKNDYTIEPAATVLLNVDFGSEAVDGAVIEECFSLARSVCEKLEESRIKYSFITNCSGSLTYAGEGLGTPHLMAILESLGRATHTCTEPMQATFQRAINSSDSGRCHIIITPNETEQLRALMEQLAHRTQAANFLITAHKPEEE
ncbi:MAG: DUF58 domain-containing protein [Oscillospiraceae bacterium]|nr:DUF58 domain-containing protein [Oscillospiraceae bacterium]